MTRRSHKKSRNGCVECKRRHVKCDETRPICSNCISSEQLCEYPEFTVREMQPRKPRKPRKNPRSPAPSTESSIRDTPPELSSLIQPDPPANMLHAQLLWHLSTKTWPSLCMGGDSQLLPPTELINHGLTASYLLNELLALAALHLGVLCENQKDYYRHHSFQLQNHALRLFHEADSDPERRSLVPAFLFSSILSIHILCDTLVFRDCDFQDFLDRFIHYLRIQRGVRTVIGGNWDRLKETSLKSVLNEGEASLQSATGAGQEYSRLVELIKAAKLGSSITQTYEQAIGALQQSLDASRTDTSINIMNGSLAWPVNVSSEYTDMLVYRRPEALVILAHYAVLLHWCRDIWVFHDGGRFLIDCISRYLGTEWTEWLIWPNHILSQ